VILLKLQDLILASLSISDDTQLRLEAAEIFYKLFNHCKLQNDPHQAMYYLNQAIEFNQLNWIYLYEMGMFIRSVRDL
jgi:hypothetical protein